MRKAYIESSVINRAVDEGLSASMLRDCIARLGFEPGTGLHTIYELGRTFLKADSSSVARGQELFSVLRDLDPTYQPEVGTLLQREVEKLRLGTVVLQFMDYWNVVATRQEVARLAECTFDDRARQFMEAKQGRKQENLNGLENHTAYVGWARQSQVIPKLRTFDDFWGYLEKQGDVPRLMKAVLPRAISTEESVALAARMPSFPAITATVRANAYLNFIIVANLVRPGNDKLDDYVHCIQASYSSAFVSADSQQLAATRLICPQLVTVDWDNLLQAG